VALVSVRSAFHVHRRTSDARIIAAAPDLLEALRGVVSAMELQEKRQTEEFHLPAEAFMPIWNAATERARAAIVKATGDAA